MIGMRAYIDSNVFIFSAVSMAEEGDAARRLLTLLAKGTSSGVTSALTFDEVFYKVKKELGHQTAVDVLENLLAMPNLVFSAADPNVLGVSLSVLKKHAIEPRDAIHLAASALSKADIFISEDKSLRKISSVKALGISEAVLLIEKTENR
jgi:predicted nucleic acid-binding protein